ncbi:MAG: cysteine hydrolase [Eubacterium sp.]|nr:cysteine hydrolase [Eubacterium sp.]
MKKALFVIDAQEVSFGENHAEFFQYDKGLLSVINQVIDDNKDNLVIYIRNLMKKNLINKFAPFHAYDGSKEAELAQGLHIVSDNVFDKYVGDAFSNKQLDEFLKKNNVDEIEIIGADGGGCVPLTAMGARKAGYTVTVNAKAVGTMMKAKAEKYNTKLKEMGVKFI